MQKGAKRHLAHLISAALLPTTMSQCAATPKALAETVLRMTGNRIKPKKIEQLTNVGMQQQQRIIKIWEETGEVPKLRLRVGRTRGVLAAEAYVCCKAFLALFSLSYTASTSLFASTMHVFHT
ncbi:hypothetical protein IW262DRAFT_751390 [Armillaria fumosa]|nr:hypothetical protein IW262DRAFT_751390 [Armillaria fumosa]